MDLLKRINRLIKEQDVSQTSEHEVSLAPEDYNVDKNLPRRNETLMGNKRFIEHRPRAAVYGPARRVMQNSLITRINNFISKQSKRYHFDYETNSPKKRQRGTAQMHSWEDAPDWGTAKYAHNLKENLGSKEFPKKYKLTNVEEESNE